MSAKRQALFLGAGFSVEFGQPLVSVLTKELYNWLTPEKFIEVNSKWKLQNNGYGAKTEKILLDLLRQENLHYEHLIGAIEVAALRFENRQERNELHGLRSWLLELIYHLLHMRHIKFRDLAKQSISLHKGIKHLVDTNSPLWIFSLNHDLVVEFLCLELGFPLQNSFDQEDIITLTLEHLPKEILKFSRLKIEGTDYPYKFFQVGESGINLLKIHGSLDIFGFDDLKSYLCLMPSDKNFDGFLESLQKINKIQQNGSPGVTNEIIAIDAEGNSQFLRRSLLSGVYKFSRKISQVISDKLLLQFQSNLNFADELIVIGYGFCDLHINTIIREWLEFTEKRRIVIVNPCQTALPDFVGHMPSQCTTIIKTAVEYLASLPGGALTQEEHTNYQLRKFIRTAPKNEVDALMEMIAKLKPPS